MVMYFSGSETTERESLADTIAVRIPMQTPQLMRLPKRSIRNRVEEWTIDKPFTSAMNLRSMSAPHTHTRFEGAPNSYTDATYPTKVKAISEIQSEAIEVSNTDRTVVMAGTDNTFDYRAGQAFIRLMQKVDHILLYGQGSPETAGSTGVSSNQRQAMGWLHLAGWTGLERVHGTKTSMVDPYGTTLSSDEFSVFYDFEHTNLTGEAFYANVLRRITNAGGDLFTLPWMWECGDLLMARVSKFLVLDQGLNVNERNIPASEGGGYDMVNWMVFPNQARAGFRTNRWLDDMTNTFVIDNTGATYYTPGSPDSEGTESRTFSGDQTMLGRKPGALTIGWLREPGFEKVETDSDSSKLVCRAEFTLLWTHPLDVAGCGNALS